MTADVTAIIVAAGEGRRMGRPKPKQFLDLAGRPLFSWALLPFEAHPDVAAIVVVLPAGDVASWTRSLTEEFGFSKIVAVVPGGERRQDSVRSGLEMARSRACPECRLVAIHDGARPLLSIELLGRCLTAARKYGAAVPVLDLSDTLIRIGSDGAWADTIDRSELRRVQTPQIFATDLLREAHDTAGEEEVTDDAQLVAALGHPVALVPGDELNLKVTGPEDLARAERLMATGKEPG